MPRRWPPLPFGEKVNPKNLVLFLVFLSLGSSLSYPSCSAASWNRDTLLIAAADEDDEDEEDDNEDGGASNHRTAASSSVYSQYSSVMTRRPVYRRKPNIPRLTGARKTHSSTKHRHLTAPHSRNKVNPAKKRVHQHSTSGVTGKGSKHQHHGIKQQPASRNRPNSQHQRKKTRPTTTPIKRDYPLTRSKRASNPTNDSRSRHTIGYESKAVHQSVPRKTSAQNKHGRAHKPAKSTARPLIENKTRNQIKRSQRTEMRSKASGKNKRNSEPPNASRGNSAKISKPPS
jgi:hypothetical protein